MSLSFVLLITFNIFAIRHVSSVNQGMMKKFGSNCTVVDHPERCVYEIIGKAFSQGYNYTEEEILSMEEDLKITECMDKNDNFIEGCKRTDSPSGSDPRVGNEDMVNFILWTKDSNITDFSEKDEFDGSNPTYFIFHGFFSKGTEGWIKNAKNKILLTKPSANVISVDWKSKASLFSSYVLYSYCTAVENIESVAMRTSKLIHSLIRTKGLHTSNLQLVGHSLGAHAAGITAKHLQKMDNNMDKISTITGLDPAGPLFFTRNSSQKLSRDDATYVQVIHTNGGTNTKIFRALFTGTFGYFPPLGDDDFYPNGGEDQPDCGWNWFCAHGRAYDYWIESIEANSKKKNSKAAPSNSAFTSSPCNSLEQVKDGSCDKCSINCIIMGYFLQAPRIAKDLHQRILYLTIKRESPNEANFAEESTNTVPIVLGISLTIIIAII